MKKKADEKVSKDAEPEAAPELTYQDGIEAARLNSFLESAQYSIERQQPVLVFPKTLMVLCRLAQARQKEIGPKEGKPESCYWFKWEMV